MKNLFLSLCLLLSVYAFSQNTPFQSTSQLNSWNIALGLGQVQFYGDLKEYDWYPSKLDRLTKCVLESMYQLPKCLIIYMGLIFL